MKKLIIILICFLGIQSLQTDSIGNIQENCETQIKDRDQNAFITFYGDSLGDFVDFPAYGFVGWDAYLGFWKPDIDWRVQNFAIAGWTTNKRTVSL